MSKGVNIKSDAKITGAGFPKLVLDKMMPQKGGALVLLDLSNTSVDQPASLPTATKIPNLAHKQALAMIGSGDAASVAAIVTNVTNGTTGKVEITGKKGIHTITSASGSGAAFRAELPTAVRQYMVNNLNHRFYHALSYRVTRASANADYTRLGIHGVSSFTANYKVVVRKSDFRPSNSQAPTRFFTATSDPAGNRDGAGLHFFDLAEEGYSGTIPANASQLLAYLDVTVGLSEIEYFWYIEDLTVSERTVEQARAAVYGAHLEIHGLGGKFENDTFTDPATIA